MNETSLSPSRLAAEALSALRRGDPSQLESLRPIAGSIAPDTAMDLLDTAALTDDADAIDILYDLFGTFEMPGIPLAKALGRSKTRAAEALLDHGTTLSQGFIPTLFDGDTSAWRNRRYVHYLDRMLPADFRTIPGRAASTIGTGREEQGLVYRIAIAADNHDLLATLATEGRLAQADTDGLLFAALVDGYYDLAKRLVAAGANPYASVCLRLRYGPGWGMKTVCSIADVFYDSAPVELARTIADIAPDQIAQLWSTSLMDENPAVAKLFVPYLEPACVDDLRELAVFLAERGWAEELSILLSWPLEDPRTLVEAALEAATDERRTETQILLLNALRELEPAPDDDLEL
jgi:hypothetical protein